MVKRILLFLLAFSLFKLSYAQDSTYVNWTASASKSGAGKYELKLTGLIEKGWHLYAKANVNENIYGLVITFPDSSIKQDLYQLKADITQIADPIFENHLLEIV